MARKPIVDRDEVLRMLREGSSTQMVADLFGVSRQAIDLHRRDFISRGLLSSERAMRRSSRLASESVTAGVPPPATATTQSAGEQMPGSPQLLTGASLDDVIELVISAVAALRRLPEVETELAESRRQYQQALEELERLRDEARKRRDQEIRWRSAQRRPETTPRSH